MTAAEALALLTATEELALYTVDGGESISLKGNTYYDVAVFVITAENSASMIVEVTLYAYCSPLP